MSSPKQTVRQRCYFFLWISLGVIAFYKLDYLGSRATGVIFSVLLAVGAIVFKKTSKARALSYLFYSPFAKRTAAFGLVYFSMYTVFTAHTNIKGVSSKEEYYYMTSSDLSIFTGLDPEAHLPLLGKIGEFYVLGSPDLGQKFFVLRSDMNVFRIRHHKRIARTEK